jgi:hypothetical protein
MSGNVFLYGGLVGPMALFKAWRKFEGEYPFVLEVNGVEWAMTPDELSKLARVATGIIAALTRPGKRPTPGRRYHAEPRDGDKVIMVELGIEAAGDADLFYFRFGDDVVRFEVEEGRDLLRLSQVLNDDLQDMRRASQPAPDIAPPPPGERWKTWRPRWAGAEPDWPGW